MKKNVAKGMYLVSWKDMGKDPSEPLPMRPFESRTEAECYAMGCTDVMVVVSKSLTSDDWDSIRRDFIITTDRD